jgi:hypothetical protein
VAAPSAAGEAVLPTAVVVVANPAGVVVAHPVGVVVAHPAAGEGAGAER